MDGYGFTTKGCTSYYEGTELKANHNYKNLSETTVAVVLAITKVLNWKLITTGRFIMAGNLMLY